MAHRAGKMIEKLRASFLITFAHRSLSKSSSCLLEDVETPLRKSIRMR
jgi:hypothetical protein